MKPLMLSEPQDYVALLVRRRWWLLVTAAIGGTLVLLTAVLLPKIYESETLILVQPRDVPDDVVRDFIAWDTQERLISIQETVLSRTNLLRVINEFSEGFSEFRDLNDEAKVDSLRSRISVDIATNRGSRQATVPFFRIAYQDRDPELAQKVADRLAQLFIEQDSRTREQQVYGTTEFLRSEVTKVSRSLNEAEVELAQLKRRYQTALPEQLETNLRTLDRLQEQVKANTEATDRYLSMKLDLQRRISEAPEVITREVRAANPRIRNESPLVGEYRRKEIQLKELETRYTELHPDIVRLKAELATLEKEIPAEDLLEIQESLVADTLVVNEPNPLYQELNSQLLQVNTELAILKERHGSLEQQVDQYAGRIEATPRVEQTIASVQREYVSLQAEYDELQDKLRQAELAESLESRQKGEQFQVVDPASYPFEPTKPNRLLVALVGFLGIIGVGVVLAAGVDLADQKIHSYTELERLLGTPVLAEIPHILADSELQTEKRTALFRWVVFISACGFALIGVYLVYATPQVRTFGADTLARLLNW